MALLLVILTIIHQQLTPQIFKIEILLMLIDIINTIMTTIANIWLKPNLFVEKIPIVTNHELFGCACLININTFRYINSILI